MRTNRQELILLNCICNWWRNKRWRNGGWWLRFEKYCRQTLSFDSSNSRHITAADHILWYIGSSRQFLYSLIHITCLKQFQCWLPSGTPAFLKIVSVYCTLHLLCMHTRWRNWRHRAWIIYWRHQISVAARWQHLQRSRHTGKLTFASASAMW